MIAYDKRIYRRPQLEPFCDPEWEEAENANEKMIYYQQQTKTGMVIRRYKPSLAKLVMERTGWTLIPLKEGGAE